MRILRTLKGCFNDREFQKDWLVVDGVSEQCRMPLGRANMVSFQDYHCSKNSPLKLSQIYISDVQIFFLFQTLLLKILKKIRKM